MLRPHIEAAPVRDCAAFVLLAALLEGVITGWHPDGWSGLVHFEGVAVPVLLALAGWKAERPMRAVLAGVVLGLLVVSLVPLRSVPAGDCRMVVEKSRNRLSVYRGDGELLTIPVGLGAVAGPKQVVDDGRTPEGGYRVCAKEARGGDYWLGVNYPNGPDAWRGRRQGLLTWAETWLILAQNRNGREPWQRTALGNGIGIHRGPRYTAGSICASQEDLARLYPLVERGCPLEIRP